MTDFLQNLLRAGRTLARRPSYPLVAVLAVATGVASIVAVFALVDAALLSPLPYPEPERLVTADVISPRGHAISLSVPNYRDWSGSPVFEAAGASAGWAMVRSGASAAGVVEARQVLGDFFGALGWTPARGRLFGGAETEPGAAPVAVLGAAFHERLGGGADLLGRALILDGVAYTIVGVLPPGIGYPSAETEAYLPLGALREELPWLDRNSSFGLRLVGRLRPGVDRSTAQADLERIAREAREREGFDVAAPRLRTLSDLLVGALAAPLALLFAAAGLVVLLAVANVVHLFLARAESRRAELAVRSALGAPRSDALRLLLLESAWIALAGSSCGLLLSGGLVRALAGWFGEGLPSFVTDRLAVGPRAGMFALTIGLLIALALGVLPALLTRHGRGDRALVQARATGDRRSHRFRTGLVVAELALGALLVTGASLLGTSLERLRTVDKGFDERGVAWLRTAPPEGRFRSAAQWVAFHEEVLERARALPGARTASVSTLVPLSGSSNEQGLFPEGVGIDPHAADSTLYNVVSPDWFATFGVELVRGRLFDERDRQGAARVTVVDESLAEPNWPGEDPIGKRVTFEAEGNPHARDAVRIWREIVGVVRNVRHYEVQSPSRVQVYVPLAQAEGAWGAPMHLAVRTSHDPSVLVGEMSRLLAAIDPTVAVRSAATLEATVDVALSAPRTLARASRALAALAMLLAGVGVFAVAAHGVAERRRELALRQALGASPGKLLAAELARGLRWSLAGSALGLVGALLAARAARSLLWGVAPFEPMAHAASLASLAALAIVAGLAPALRAVRTDPVRVLREEA